MDGVFIRDYFQLHTDTRLLLLCSDEPQGQCVSQLNGKCHSRTHLVTVICFCFLHFISALDSKAPKAEDIEEEDDDVPGMDN